MFIYATTKDNSSNPIVIEGHRVYRDKDGAEYSNRAEIALSLLKTDAVVEKSNFFGYKSDQYMACQYITKTKDFAGRNLPITICMKQNDHFDMTAIHTLWEERYSLSVVELNEIQKCLESLTRKGKSFSTVKIISFVIAVLVILATMKCCN
ncbi:MAG: hypothetical protein MJ033_07930 [Victivallaceae bacterium]|nr:hypothetical protein [Victivallaceae bacterium]